MTEPTTVDLVALFLMAFCVVSLTISWCVRHALTKKLRREHRAQWEKLGRPQTFGPNLNSVFKTLKFIWSNQSNEIGSSNLRRLVLADRVSLALSLLLFLAFFIAYLLALAGGAS